MLQIAGVNDYNCSGSSFHGVTIHTTAAKLLALLGSALEWDKSQYHWSVRLKDDESGEEVKATVYDWKEWYLSPNTPIYFHVGGFDEADEKRAAEAIEKALADIN